MTIYVSTGNGDWLELPHSRLILHVLDTDDLVEEELAEIELQWGGLENDKFEDVICEYGYQKEIII